MLNQRAQTAADPCEIVSARALDAPRSAVFEAFSDPEQLVRWWGPTGFTNTIHVFDFRPGGAWRFTMHGPDGADYPMTKAFIDLAPPERIVYRNEHPTHGFVMTMTLVAEGSRTQLTWRMRFDTEDEARKVRSIIEHANEQNFDRLAAHLASR
jgi:uncharacterized protein YndB with AHSA1/START domain